MSPGRTIITAITGLWLAACAQSPVVPYAERVFTGGGVYTVDPDLPWASAVAIRDGRIAYVGDESGIEAFIGPETEVTDISDRMLMPGFIDSHNHPMAAGTRFLRCDLAGFEWPDEVLAALRDCKDELAPGEWLRGIAMDESSMQGSGPHKSLVDGFTGDTPMVVQTEETRTVWANSAALAAAGIDESTPNPEKGKIVREPATDETTGVLLGTAVGELWGLIPLPRTENLLEALRRASRLANGFGITSSSEAKASPGIVEAFLAAEANGELSLRVQASLALDEARGPDQIGELAARRDRAAGGRFTAPSVKLFLDGSKGRTGALLEPYAGTEDDFGTLNYTSAELNEIVSRLDGAGFDLHMHAYGDAAVRQGLDAIENTLSANPHRVRRHVLAHLALVHPDDLPRFAELGVAVNISPLWAWLGEERQAEAESLGAARARRLLAFNDLFDSGALITAGSDWISKSMNPLYSIQVAVTRRPPDGSGPAWNTVQRVTLEQMLAAYTINGAWQARLEDEVGSIEVGKAADLVLLEENLFEVDPMRLKDVRVLLTLLEGEVVYQSP